jgi:photosystem II stability/assembly factor-like uncharacterized protein
MFVGGSDGGSVGIIESFDGGATMEYDDTVGLEAQAFLLMATAVKNADDSTGYSVLAGGLLGAALSVDGHTWSKVGPEIVTQDIKYEAASGLYTMAGTFVSAASGAGLAVSADGGATFTTVAASGFYQGLSYVRYGTAPTTSTFYVTVGTWGASAAPTPKAGERALTSRLSVGADGRVSQRAARGDATDDATAGFWAQVLKTADGGATWSVVFEDTTSGFYPNDIHCFDADSCAFVVEGVGAPMVITTTDGGASWDTHPDDSGSVSLMAVRMTGPTEVWAAGGGDKGRLLHTVDLASWAALETDPSDAVLLSSFAFTNGGASAFATGVLRSQLCSIVKLDF